jgi:lipopolysaccharide transport system permease protein
MEYRPSTMDSLSEHSLPPVAPANFAIGAEVSHMQRQGLALTDALQAARLWRLGVTLGWLDIKLKYRGSLLGPFWLTISTAVMIAAIGGVYGALFHTDLKTYLPFLALSLVLWNAMNTLVTDACFTFTQAEGMIRSLRMPFFVHALRVVVRTIISFAHNVPVIIAVFAIFNTWPGAICLKSLPGFALWTVDSFAACMLLGTFCARFRDIPPIVGSVMQIAFYVTPVVWQPKQLGAQGWWLPFNPFDSLIDVVRAPLLGQEASGFVWGLALFYSVAFCAVTWVVFARVRTRIAYWV